MLKCKLRKLRADLGRIDTLPRGGNVIPGKVCVTMSERVQLSESIAVVGKKRARFSDLPPFLLKVPFRLVTILSSLETNPLWAIWDGPLVKPQYDQDWGFAYLL